MLCPKCYGKIDKKTNRCSYCGFKMSELDGATNKQAKQAMKTIYKDDILYSTKLPEDVKKSHLVLWCVFLGFFGAHHFSVGKFWQGFFMCLVTCLTATFSIVTAFVQGVYQKIFEVLTVFQGAVLIMWVSDLVKIVANRYKVPVYKESFSKK